MKNNEIRYDVELSHDFCRRNKEEVQKSKQIGCFYCLAIVPAEEVSFFDNGNAICPKCKRDTVLPDSCVPADMKFLEQMCNFWFGQKKLRPG